MMTGIILFLIHSNVDIMYLAKVRLFEFPEWSGKISTLLYTRRLTAEAGAVVGDAEIELVTTNLSEAVIGADIIMVCTQSGAHERIASELTSIVKREQMIVLNPGSTGGALKFARVFRAAGLTEQPVLAELQTLTYVSMRPPPTSSHDPMIASKQDCTITKRINSIDCRLRQRKPASVFTITTLLFCFLLCTCSTLRHSLGNSMIALPFTCCSGMPCLCCYGLCPPVRCLCVH